MAKRGKRKTLAEKIAANGDGKAPLTTYARKQIEKGVVQVKPEPKPEPRMPGIVERQA